MFGPFPALIMNFSVLTTQISMPFCKQHSFQFRKMLYFFYVTLTLSVVCAFTGSQLSHSLWRSIIYSARCVFISPRRNISLSERILSCNKKSILHIDPNLSAHPLKLCSIPVYSAISSLELMTNPYRVRVAGEWIDKQMY